MVLRLSSFPTFYNDSIALSLTTESSFPTIISSGSNNTTIFSLIYKISHSLPNYSARFIISSGLQSILSISSVSIGTSSSDVLSGPSSAPICLSLYIECNLAFGSSLLKSSMSRAIVLI